MIKKIFSLSLVFFFVFCFYSLSEAVLIQGSVKDINLKTQQVEGVPFVPLIQVCDANGVSYAWDSLTSRVRLYLKGDQLVVTVNEKVIDLNGEIKFLSKPVRMVGGAVMVPQSMLELPWWGMKKKPMLEVVIKKASPYSIDSIILDPGHGGKDRGAVGTTGLKEKELVLAICEELKVALEKRDITVHMTRENDSYVSLSDRAKKANGTDADLFISVHANGHRSRRAHGFEIYYLTDKVNSATRDIEMIENKNGDKRVKGLLPDAYHKNPKLWDAALREHRREAKDLAKEIDKSISGQRMIRNRGVKSARFFVLKWVDKPSILIELGFLTNANEERNLQNATYKKKMVQSLVQGIIRYKKKYDKKNSG